MRIAILTIISIHAVFFAGLLMQGCRRDENKGGGASNTAEPTNQVASVSPEGTTYYPPSTQEIAAVTAATPVVANPTPAVTEPPVSTPPPPIITEPTVDGKTYKVVKGDTLAKIAKANRVSLTAIAKANPGLEPSKIRAGQTIQIPPAPTASAGIGFAEPGKAEAAGLADNIHQVKAGETLTKIAKQHNTTVKAIMAANNLKTHRLVVHQKLKLPNVSSALPTVDSSKTSGVSKMTATNPAYVTPVPASVPSGTH